MECTLGAIAGFVTAGILLLTVLVTGFFARGQLKAARQARSAEIEIQLIHDLTSADRKERLSSIYKMSPSEVEQLQPGSKWACEIEEILDRLEMLELFVSKEIIDEEIAIIEWQDPAIRCWWRLHPYIHRQRAKRGHYAPRLENFVERCIEYQIDKFPKEEWTKYEGANLVEILLQSEDFRHLRTRKRKKLEALGIYMSGS